MQTRTRLGVLGGLAIGMVACATSAPPPDLRGSTALTSPEPQLLLAGPARLLHVNADRRAGLVLYRVRSGQGSAADCRGAGKETAIDWDQGSDLLVGKDETICVAVQGHTQLSWHARPALEDLVATQHASLDRY
jgi:hypothetical protein